MRREPLFLIFLVFIILGCPIYTGPSSSENRTYDGVGVTSFTSDLYDFPADTITNIMLQIFNYGDYEATNVKAKLVGVQGAEPYVELQGTPTNSLPLLSKNNAALFFWTYKFKDPGVETDFIYSINAKTYYEYMSLATKEVVFRNQAGTSSIETGGGSSKGPLNITLSSPNTVFLPNPTDNEFTITVKIDNLDGGYPTCRQESSSDTNCMDTGKIEEESYKNYIKKIDLYFSKNWDLQHPEEWFTGDRSSGTSTTEAACTEEGNLYHCTYAPDFTTAENVDRRLYLTQGVRNTFNIGFTREGVSDTHDSVSATCTTGTCSDGMCSPITSYTAECPNPMCHCNKVNGVPGCRIGDQDCDEVPFCDDDFTLVGCDCIPTISELPATCPSGYNMLVGCDCYKSITGEKIESIKVEITYSYVVSSPTIDLTVQGSQQTY